jgi:hypothetical protein
MAGVRDPAFWKRFSVAVHMDEEQQGEKQRGGTHHGGNKDAYVLHLLKIVPTFHLKPSTNTFLQQQRFMARSPTKQEKEPYHGLLVLLVLLSRPCRWSCRSDNLVGGEWSFGQDWAEW